MAAPVSPTAGQLIDKTFWDDEIYEQFTDIYASWTSYTPTWSAASGTPSVGNGSLAAAYKLIGQTAFVRLRLVIGTTSTLGTGLWGFTLPAGATPNAVQSVPGFLSNSAGTVRHPLGAYLTAGSGVFRIAVNGSSGVGSAAPFAWADGDQLVLCGSYEIS